MDLREEPSVFGVGRSATTGAHVAAIREGMMGCQLIDGTRECTMVPFFALIHTRGHAHALCYALAQDLRTTFTFSPQFSLWLYALTCKLVYSVSSVAT